mmetsp:Transcript_95063/g.142417  ORF Transcript_95063/g.142417 Transcript_95063/m.142417 type:complete len:81 (+) Transcript_95063:1468-1710(+)
MNAKTGLALWLSKIPNQIPKRTMIIGADVFHNVGQEKKSVIGFCASMDPAFSKFFTQVVFQKKEAAEIMTNVSKLVKKAI